MKIEDAKKIFKKNFIGPDELASINVDLNFHIPKNISEIDFEISDLNPEDYILIYGCSQLKNLQNLNLKKLIDIFGISNNPNHVNFYNQDWYLSEDFINKSLSNRWYLIQKNIQEKTRGKAPEKEIQEFLPSSILCAYTFFCWWIIRKETLWANDFIWCSDKDRFDDRIYVGKYIDEVDTNRSGFSIHRHLSIKSNYGSIRTH